MMNTIPRYYDNFATVVPLYKTLDLLTDDVVWRLRWMIIRTAVCWTVLDMIVGIMICTQM